MPAQVPSSTPVELFFWVTPNCWKISIALEEMNLPFSLRPIAIVRGEQFSPEFMAISPNNRVPAIRDPTGSHGQPVTMFESGAILQYLGRKTGKFYPADEATRTAVDQWLFWQTSGLGPMFGQATHFRIYAPTLVDDPGRLEYSVQRYDKEVNRLLGVLERRLADWSYVAGEYSIADMAIYPWLTTLDYLGQDLGDFPRVRAWFDRVGGRPAVQKGMAAGAELRGPPPQPGTGEQRQFSEALFNQTARSVSVAVRGTRA